MNVSRGLLLLSEGNVIMSKVCPLYGGIVLYLDCLECNDRIKCRSVEMKKYKTMIIGIDQSYQNTGISICCDGKIKLVTSIHLEKLKNNTEKRNMIRKKLRKLIELNKDKAEKVIVVVEQIRLRSRRFISIDYIKSMGSLNAVIVDVCKTFDIEVYSVDTRCWKATVVGTSLGKKNRYGVPEEKYPTVAWCMKQGLKNSIIEEIKGRKKNGTFVGKDGKRYMFNNDACDSAAISMFYFKGRLDKLTLEN